LRLLDSYAPGLTAIVATLWVNRPVVFSHKLPGNIGDARWTIGVHEHWFRVWQGDSGITSLHYYVPLNGTLGTSDAFVVQGQIHALFRAFGVGLVNSWAAATVIAFGIGALGLAALSKRVLATTPGRVAFVSLACASYPVFVNYGHIQLVGMLSVSWIALALHDLSHDTHARRGAFVLGVGTPLLALSSWYSFVMGTITLAVLGLCLALVRPLHKTRAVVAQSVRNVYLSSNIWLLGLLAALTLAGWSLVIATYLPVRDLLPAPPLTELQLYSPRWSDLVNGTYGGGGVWSGLYERVFSTPSANIERTQGFTPILLAAFAIAALIAVRKVALGDEASDDRRERGNDFPVPADLVAASLTIALVLIPLIADESGFVGFRLAWAVPGMDSIRAPFRVQTLLFAIAIFVVLRSIELWQHRLARNSTSRRNGWLAAAAVGLLAVALFVEMQRPVATDWTSHELLPPQLAGAVPQLKDECDAVVVVPSGPAEPPWLTPINGVILATVAAIDTPQGYGRADPIDYPAPGSSPEVFAQWMRRKGFAGQICSADYNGLVTLL
jgi:hypothetical protein